MVDISKLSPEEKATLKAQFEAEEKQKADSLLKEKQSYRQLKNETVEKIFQKLLESSQALEVSKAEYYAEFESLEELKAELFGVKDGQKSHTWTNDDGTISITTGFNMVSIWDETKSVGLTKVNNWLDGQVNDDNKKFVTIIRELLKPNEKGDLKANRVLDLQKHADSIGDPELIEAVKVLSESHKTVRSGTYIKAEYVNDRGEKIPLPLSFSSIK